MRVAERLTKGVYIANRKNDGTGFRCVVRTSAELAEGDIISSANPLPEFSVESLCHASQIFYFGEFNDEVDLSERAKTLFIEVLADEEDPEWAYDFAHGNEIF